MLVVFSKLHRVLGVIVMVNLNLLFQHQILMLPKFLSILIISQLIVRIFFVLSESVENQTLLGIFVVLPCTLIFGMSV